MDKNTGQGFLERLSARERKLLSIWAIAMSFMAVFLCGWLLWSSLSEKADAAEAYQNTLDLIARKQQDFLANKGKADKTDLNAQIEGNEIKLQSFLDREANKESLKITNFKESIIPLTSKQNRKEGEPGLVEESLTITIDSAEFKNLGRFMDALARSKELITIKRIDLERSRTFKADGTFKMNMTVSTYKKGAS